METFPISTLPFNELLRGYELEAEGLATVAESTNFSDILARFSNYETFLAEKHQPGTKLVSKLSKSTGIINTSAASPTLRDIFYTAHIAACCDLFNGSLVPATFLNHGNIASWINEVLKPYREADDTQLEQLSSRLHSMDAVRTMNIVRCMGLVTRTPDSMHQLSLGAGPATKDIRSIHLTPQASLQTTAHTIAGEKSAMQLSMHVHENKPADIIITDSDPQREEQYRLLNDSNTNNLLAINRDTNETLQDLPDILKQKNMPPRNLVIALRIDHRMIPNVQQFLGLISMSIDSAADLIVTMGSGFNIDDFRGRTGVIMELFESLKRSGLTPVLIKLHGSGHLEEQRNSPSFGLSNITTYEILYCKLKKKKLEKSFLKHQSHR